MSSIIENKDRILLAFQDIGVSIQNKELNSVNENDDVSQYANRIRNLVQEDTVVLRELGTFSISSTQAGSSIFNLNEMGENYFILHQNEQECIKGGYFVVMLCSGIVSPTGKTLSNLVFERNHISEITCQTSSAYSIWSIIFKTEIDVGDTINLSYYKSSSSGTPSSSDIFANIATLYSIS